DGQGTYTMNYSILNLGTTITVLQKPAIVVGIDYYNNFNDLTKYDLVAQDFRNQKQGFVATTKLGKLEDLSDWKFTMTYSHLERYAAIDYFSQNDWARWDYSSQGSSDGRLTNFKGFEIETSYAISKKINLKLRLFSIKQIVPFGITKENGNRIRLDLNIKM
ncbi:MAG: putative porin, partial [Ferruginibacter sp.]